MGANGTRQNYPIQHNYNTPNVTNLVYGCRMHCDSNGSDKVYIVCIYTDDTKQIFDVVGHYGKSTAWNLPNQNLSLANADLSEAAKAADKLIKSKIKQYHIEDEWYFGGVQSTAYTLNSYRGANDIVRLLSNGVGSANYTARSIPSFINRHELDAKRTFRAITSQMYVDSSMEAMINSNHTAAVDFAYHGVLTIDVNKVNNTTKYSYTLFVADKYLINNGYVTDIKWTVENLDIDVDQILKDKVITGTTEFLVFLNPDKGIITVYDCIILNNNCIATTLDYYLRLAYCVKFKECLGINHSQKFITYPKFQKIQITSMYMEVLRNQNLMLFVANKAWTRETGSLQSDMIIAPV